MATDLLRSDLLQTEEDKLNVGRDTPEAGAESIKINQERIIAEAKKAEAEMAIALAKIQEAKAAEENKKATAAALAFTKAARTDVEVVADEIAKVIEIMSTLSEDFAKGTKLDLQTGLDKTLAKLEKELEEAQLRPGKEAAAKAAKEAAALLKEQNKEEKRLKDEANTQAAKALKEGEAHIAALKKQRQDEIDANRKELQDLDKLLEFARTKGDDELFVQVQKALETKVAAKEDKEFQGLISRFTGEGLEKEGKDSLGFARTKTEADKLERLKTKIAPGDKTELLIARSKKALQQVQDKDLAAEIRILIDVLTAQAAEEKIAVAG